MTTPLRVLVLEGQPDDARRMLDELRRAGLDPDARRVKTEEEYRAALDSPPDLILSDDTLSGFNALDALRLLRQRRLDVPLVCVSGAAGEEAAVAAMREGAADYLRKDRLDRLGPAVRQALDQHGPRGRQRQDDEAEARLAAIVESSDDAIFAKTLDGAILSWNPAAERLYGYTAAEIIGRPVWVLVPEGRRRSDSPEDLQNILDRLRRGERIAPFETVRVRKDGRRVEVSLTVSPVRDRSGAVIGASAIAHDITQRKRAERYLAAQHAATRILAESAGLEEAAPRLLQALGECLRWEAAVLWTLDRPAGRLRCLQTWQNPLVDVGGFTAASRQTTLAPDEGVAGRVWSTGAPVWVPDVAGEEGMPRAAAAAREGLHGAFGLPLGLGPEMAGVIEFYNREVRQPDGRLMATLDHIARQVSQFIERRRAEAAVRQSEARKAAVLEAALDAILTIDHEGRVVEVNPAAEAMFGFRQAEVLGKDMADLIVPPSWREQCREGRRHSLATGPGRIVGKRVETTALRADGSEFPVELAVTRIATQDAPLFTAYIRDLTEVRRAEEQRSRLVRHIEVLMQSTGEGLYGIDTQGRCTFINRAGAALLGYAPEEVLGRDMHSLIHHSRPDGAPYPEAECPIYRAFRQGKGVHVDDEVMWRKDGSPFPVEYSSYPVLEGGIRGAVISFQDITERKRADEALRRSEEQYRVLAETIPQLVWLYRPDGTPEFFNRRWQEYSGLTAEVMFQDARRRIIHPEDLARALEAWEHSVETGRPYEVEYRLRRADGEYRWHLARALPLHDREGRVYQWFGTATDIHDQKQAERQAAELVALLDTLLSNAPVGFAFVDRELRYVRVNSTLAAISGRPAAEYLGRKVPEMVPHLWPRVEAVYRDLLAGGGPVINLEVSAEFPTPAGPLRHFLISYYPVRIQGELCGFGIITIELTERKRLEEQFRQAQKMEAVGRLAGGVAHDFNNLLTIINGYSDLLLQSLPPDDRARTFLEEIRKAGERSAALTRQLLAFSRQQVLAPQVLDLNAVIADLEKMLRRLIGEDVRLATSPGPGLGKVRADPGQLEQVILNLAVNARDAMPQGGRLTLETRNIDLDEGYTRSHAGARPGPHVLLAVSDTGCGMTAEVRARLFEPFFTTKGVGKGTGLGLAVVHGIVRQSGGHVEVYSEPGLGTTFKIYLPRVEDPGRPARPLSGVKAAPRGTETVLLVEDEDAVRAMTRSALAGSGYRVLEAANGADALRVAGRHPGPIHLLVTDVVMPGMSGRVLADRLRPRHPGMRILYVSGYTNDAVVRHGLLQEEVQFLQKPFSPLALAHKVRAVLDGQATVPAPPSRPPQGDPVRGPLDGRNGDLDGERSEP